MRKNPVVVVGGLVGGLAAVLVVGVLAAPVLLRDRVVGVIEQELDRQLGATVRFEDASVSLLSSFPDVTVGLTGLRVTGEGPFEGVDLARVDEAAVTFDLWSVLAGDVVTIEQIAVVRPTLHVVVDEEGRSNLDILPDGDDAEASGASSYALRLDAYRIEDLRLRYEDRAAGREIVVEDLDHDGSARFSSEQATVDTRTDIAALSVVDGGATLLREVKVGWDLDADLDVGTGALTLKDNRLQLNALGLSATGTVDPSGPATKVDLAFQATETTFASLLSLVPAVYASNFDQLVSSGTLALAGRVSGAIDPSGETWPSFTVDLDVADGAFRYPDLPVGVDGVQVDARIAHPGGAADLVEVDVARFRLAVDGQPLEGRLSLRHPMTDPAVDTEMKGSLDLAKLASALPPSDGVSYAGRVAVDLRLAGRLSAFEAQRVDDVEALGTVRLADVVYTDPETAAVPVRVDKMTMTLDPRRIDVSDLAVRLGASDLSGTAQLDNLPSYLLAGDTLVGRAQLRSKKLNLDAIAGTEAEEGGAPAEAEASSLYVVPDNLDLDIGLDLARVRYGGRVYEDVRGRVAAKDGALRMDQLGMSLLGAKITMDGSYRAESDQLADVEVTLDVRELGLASAATAFETLRRLAPIAEKAKGKMNTSLTAKLRLGPDLTPDLASLFSNGNIQLLGVVLQPELMKDVAAKVKRGRFDAIDLSDTGLAYEITNGRTTLERTAVKVGGLAGTLSGSVGTLDQTLDLRLAFDVPVGDLAAAVPVGKLTSGEVPVVAKIGGTFAKPTVKVDVGGAVDALVGDVKQQLDAGLDQAIAAAQVKADAILAEAKKLADKLIAEGKAKGDALRATAKKEGQKLVADAGNPVAKKLTQEAADKLVAEADKAAKKVEREANKAADAALAKAKTEADALVAEAAKPGKQALR